MQKNTKKFILWLVIANIGIALTMMTIGLLVIDSNHSTRMYLLGRGTGSALMFADLAAILIRMAILRRRKMREGDASSPR